VDEHSYTKEENMKTGRVLVAVFTAVLCLAILAGLAGAEEQVKGVITSIDLETNSVLITSYEQQDVTITISADDTRTLKKLRTKQLKVGDDVQVKYVIKGGKNVTTFFRLTAEC
jgi:hypothetical protein